MLQLAAVVIVLVVIVIAATVVILVLLVERRDRPAAIRALAPVLVALTSIGGRRPRV